MPSWRLADADLRAAQYPDTFEKPSWRAIALVMPGDHVKLIFEIDCEDPYEPHGERMWVVVDEVLGHGRFRGRLANHPVCIEDLEYDAPIVFEACHVIDIHAGEADEDDVVWH